MRLGYVVQSSHDPSIASVGDLMIRYKDDVVWKKRCNVFENYLLGALLKTPLHKLKIKNPQSAPFARYRDLRLKTVGNDIVRRELGVLHHMFSVAISEWNISLSSKPLSSIKKLSPGKPRDRRLEDGELNRLFDEIRKSKSHNLKSIILFAIETAMRQGEIVRTKWENIDFSNNTLRVMETKNGYPRTIPLSSTAIDIIEALQKAEN